MNTDDLEGIVQGDEQVYLQRVAKYLHKSGVPARVEMDLGHAVLVLPDWDAEDGFTVSFETEGHERELNIVPFAADHFPKLPIKWPQQTALCITRWIHQLEYNRQVRPPKSATSVELANRYAGEEEWIISNVHNDAWKCICGNDAMSDGFYHVTIKLSYPSVGHSEVGDDTLSVCMKCGRLIDQETHQVNPIDTLDDFDTHRVQVVGYVPFSTLQKLIEPDLLDQSEEKWGPEDRTVQPHSPEWGPWGPEGRQGH